MHTIPATKTAVYCSQIRHTHTQACVYIYIYIYIYRERERERERESERYNNYNNSVALVPERSIPTERSPLVGEVIANICRSTGVAESAQRIPYGRNLNFPDRSRYFFFQVAPQLYSRS
jgi:hypothetical protein